MAEWTVFLFKYRAASNLNHQSHQQETYKYIFTISQQSIESNEKLKHFFSGELPCALLNYVAWPLPKTCKKCLL